VERRASRSPLEPLGAGGPALEPPPTADRLSSPKSKFHSITESKCNVMESSILNKLLLPVSKYWLRSEAHDDVFRFPTGTGRSPDILVLMNPPNFYSRGSVEHRNWFTSHTGREILDSVFDKKVELNV